VVLTGSDGGPVGKFFMEKLKYIKGLYFMQPNYPDKFRATGHDAVDWIYGYW